MVLGEYSQPSYESADKSLPAIKLKKQSLTSYVVAYTLLNMQDMPRIVIDTNILVAGLRSQRGLSNKLITLADTNKFQFCVSVPLVLEYEDVLKRESAGIKLPRQTIDDILDYLIKIAVEQDIFFLWRPFLKDAKDDMVLELAVASGCSTIVTFNVKDFAQVDTQFGIQIMTPKQFLHSIGEFP